MKLVSWNCHQCYRKKADFVLERNPDILIIPECESTDRLGLGLFSSPITGQYWFANDNEDGITNYNKGIGIFSYNGYQIKLLDCFNGKFRYVIPVEVFNQTKHYIVFGIWAQQDKKQLCLYSEHILNAIEYYSSLLDADNVILAGDFNSGLQFDLENPRCKFREIVSFLAKKKISSAYHTFFKENFGDETHPTHYFQYKNDRPFHIDYCFASASLIDKLTNVEVGTYEEWCSDKNRRSDHTPLLIDFSDQ
ncbi:MAG: endonuclease/exonuclease/phosphatase family protein [Bacteroidales bacterium]|nr:endonuclease/exonuclease/phosphatase family protein [Bacteroidales bacterium]